MIWGEQYRMKNTLLPFVAAVFILSVSLLYAGTMVVTEQDTTLSQCYMALFLEGFVFLLAIVIKQSGDDIYIFDPFFMVTLLFVLLFYAAPLIQFSVGETARYGIDITPYCLEGTLYVMLGYISFFLVYQVSSGGGDAWFTTKGFYREPSKGARGLIAKWSVWIWVIAYLMCCANYMMRGYGILYIISGGFGGEQAIIQEDSFAFLAYAKLSLISSWLMYFCYGKQRAVKLCMFFLTFTAMMLGGGRASLLILLLAPVVVTYVKDRRSPNFWLVIGLVVAAVLFFAIIQVARVGIRSGMGFDLSGISSDMLFGPFSAEINDFMSYYALLPVVPEHHDFLFGSQMFGYSLILLIPRALWPGKPYPQVYDLVQLSLGDMAVANGNAYPALGEYYVEFGVVGIVVLMGLFAIACKFLRRLYLNSEGSSLSVVAYGLFYPFIFSLVARGYFPQNFTTALFLFAPVVIVSYVVSRGSSNNKDSVNR